MCSSHIASMARLEEDRKTEFRYLEIVPSDISNVEKHGTGILFNSYRAPRFIACRIEKTRSKRILRELRCKKISPFLMEYLFSVLRLA